MRAPLPAPSLLPPAGSPRLRAWALAALAAGMALAGCFAEEPAGLAEPGGDPGEAAAPAVDDGRAPMPRDLGHMPHMHDYWEGRERVTLHDGAVDPNGGDLFFAFTGLAQGQLGMALWRLPDNATVMEGTGRMELTATWDDPRVTSVAVRTRTGPSEPWSAPLALPQGETIGIDVTPETTDLPHMTTSRWQFMFAPADSPGTLLAPFHLRVDIVKLRDIMTFPGHPELFEGRPEKVLHEREHEHSESSYVARIPNLATQGEFTEKTVAPDQIVPMETKAMRVEVEVLETSAFPGDVAEIRFFYRGADTSYYGHPTVLPIEGSFAEKRLVYQFPVAPEETDSPYADKSQWIFFVEPATKFTGAEEEPTMGGMTDVSIKYRLKVVAYDHELDTYSKREGDE